MWMPRPSSRATASARRPRCRPRGPVPGGGREHADRAVEAGSASPARSRVPSASSASRPGLELLGHVGPGDRLPRLERRDWTRAACRVFRRTGSTPSAAHSAAIRSSSAAPPSRTKQRAAPRAVPVSSTATRMTESRSSSERTLRAIDDSSRSRSSASWSADAERARSSASAASAATVRSGPSSSVENARCSGSSRPRARRSPARRRPGGRRPRCGHRPPGRRPC